MDIQERIFNLLQENDKSDVNISAEMESVQADEPNEVVAPSAPVVVAAVIVESTGCTRDSNCKVVDCENCS